MAFCKKCGTQYEEGTKFCPSCGASTAEQGNQQTNGGQSGFSAKFAEMNNTKDFSNSLDANDVNQNRVMGILAYISWLVLVPIFAAKDSKFARFHANQGLILLILEAALIATGAIFGWIPVFGLIVKIIISIVWIPVVVLMVIGIVNASKGKAKELPFIGQFRILK